MRCKPEAVDAFGLVDDPAALTFEVRERRVESARDAWMIAVRRLDLDGEASRAALDHELDLRACGRAPEDCLRSGVRYRVPPPVRGRFCRELTYGMVLFPGGRSPLRVPLAEIQSLRFWGGP